MTPTALPEQRVATCRGCGEAIYSIPSAGQEDPGGTPEGRVTDRDGQQWHGTCRREYLALTATPAVEETFEPLLPAARDAAKPRRARKPADADPLDETL